MKETINQTSSRRSRTYCRAPNTRRITAPRNTVLVGDALTRLRELPDDCVDSIITSPPYHLLRRYGGGPDEIGTESTVHEYVKRIVGLCDEVARVLKPTGVFWLNLGDSFSRHTKYAAPPKSMLLAPERILLALAERGWIVRNKVVWYKPNHLPASVRDRLTTAWEPLFVLTRSPHYFFDLDAIRIPHTSQRPTGRKVRADGYDATKPQWAGPLAGSNDGLMRAHAEGRVGHPLGKNPGDMWAIPSGSSRHGHRASFPERLVERPLLSSCPEQTCVGCGSPWTRPAGEPETPLAPTCDCNADTRPGLVLDPFMGSGTVGVVAKRLGRDWLGIELNADYAALAERRIAETPGPDDERPPP